MTPPDTEGRMTEEGVRVERRKATPQQVALQCKVVASLARSIADIHDDYQKMMEAGDPGALAQITGERTADFMETFGDMLNDMDAVDPADDWMVPVFDAAHELFPVARMVAFDPNREQRIAELVAATRALVTIAEMHIPRCLQNRQTFERNQRVIKAGIDLDLESGAAIRTAYAALLPFPEDK